MPTGSAEVLEPLARAAFSQEPARIMFNNYFALFSIFNFEVVILNEKIGANLVRSNM
jgi:hypothetical protein